MNLGKWIPVVIAILTAIADEMDEKNWLKGIRFSRIPLPLLKKIFFRLISPKGSKQVLTEQKRRRVYQERYQAIALCSGKVGNRVENAF